MSSTGRSLLQQLLWPINRGRLIRAEDAYRTQPTSDNVIRLTNLLLWAGEVDHAYALTAKATIEFKDHPEVHRLYQSVRARRAKDLLRAALASLREDARSENFVRAADLLRSTGSMRKALNLIRSARKLFPDHWTIEYTTGRIYYDQFLRTSNQADLSECIRVLTRAVGLEPTQYKSLFLLALACTRGGLYDEALAWVTAILSRLPEDSRAIALRARIQNALAARKSAPGRRHLSAAPAPAAGSNLGATTDFPASALAALQDMPRVLGCFLFDGQWSLLQAFSRETPIFDFQANSGAIAAMAAGCKLDVDRIGLGTLRVCNVSGDGWRVVILVTDDMNLVTFLNGTSPCDVLNTILGNVLEQVN